MNSVFPIVFVKKECLEPGSIEGSNYYAKDQVRETHVTTPFFMKQNIGYNVLECEEHISNCFCQKRIPWTGSIEGSHYYAKDQLGETHVTTFFLRNKTLAMVFWSVKNIFATVLVKKEYLKLGSIEGSHYYDKVRVRETHVTNPLFMKWNIGYDI